MAKKAAKIIELTEDVALKMEDGQYIIAYLYKNGKTGEESWISDSYHKHLGSLFRALPDYIMRRSDVSSLAELYQVCMETTKKLESLFEQIKYYDTLDYELHIVKKDKANESESGND